MLGLIRKFAQWPWPLKRISREVSDTWAQFRFENNEAINEVTETPIAISSSTVLNGGIYTTNDGNSNFSFPGFYLEDSDFTIELKFNVDSVSSAASFLLGVWATSTGFRSWNLHITADGKLGASFSVDGTASKTVYSNTSILTHTPYHLAVTRKNDIIRMYLNGIEVGSMTLAGVIAKSDGIIRSIGSLTTQWLNGKRWDIRIVKECLYDAPFQPVPLLPYVRPEYATNMADQIVAQYGFRRNSLEDEAGNGTGVLYGTASVSEGRIKQTAVTTSYFKLPIRKFGQGDFTIELMAKVSSVNSSYGASILGHWKAGTAASDENRWCIHISAQGQISWNQARSANADDRHYFISPNGKFKFNTYQHIVVEKIGQTVSIYIDGELAASQDGFDFPIRGEAPHYARSLSSQNAYTMAGEVWNIRIVDQAVYKGQVKTKPTFPALPREVKDPWYQFLFDGNSYDDVTGRPMSLTSATVTNGILSTTSGYSSKATFGEFEVDAGEDFTIELKVNISSLGSGGGMLLGQYGGSSSNIAWAIYVTNTQSVRWYQSADGSTVSYVQTTKLLSLGIEHHIAVTRRNGKVTIFIDGKAEATLNNNDAFFNSTSPTGITWWNSNGFMNGNRWDIRFVRGQAKYIEDFEPKPLLPFVRRSYDLYEQPKVLRQFTFREGDTTDEISNSPVSLFSSTITNGAIRTTFASNSRFNLQAAYFGDGDFTVECKVNIARKSSYFYLLAQWYGGGSTISDSRNSWGLSVGDDMKPGFIFKADNIQNTLPSDIALQYNKDHHIVVERVDGVMSIYVDGVLGKSWANNAVLPVSTTALIANYALSGTGGYAEYSLRDIRIASGAMYKGKIPKLNYLPKPKQDTAIEASAFQVLVADNTIEQELSDHAIEASMLQVLTNDSMEQELSDHSLEASIIQVLVKA